MIQHKLGQALLAAALALASTGAMVLHRPVHPWV